MSDGLGNVQGHTIATSVLSGGDTWRIDYNWHGTYSLHADGTGFLTMIPNVLVCEDVSVAPPFPTVACGTPEPARTFAFTFSEHLGEAALALTEVRNTVGSNKVFLGGSATVQ